MKSSAKRPRFTGFISVITFVFLTLFSGALLAQTDQAEPETSIPDQFNFHHLMERDATELTVPDLAKLVLVEKELERGRLATSVSTALPLGVAGPEIHSSAITAVNNDETYRYTILTTPDNNDRLTVTGSFPNWLTLTGSADGVVSTYAGTGVEGFANGPAASAQFAYPNGIVSDAAGNIYVADHHAIRKITPEGVVSTFAGSDTADFRDGSTPLFNTPKSMTIDAQGNIYVADSGNKRIRKITPEGEASTVAGTGVSGDNDGPVSSATFSGPSGVIFDDAGNMYVRQHFKIRKVTPAGWVSTLASGFNGVIEGMAIGPDGNIYASDTFSHQIKRITPAGVMTTFAGIVKGFMDGPALSAQFDSPGGLAFDDFGNLWVVDTGNHAIRKISPDGIVSTVAGSGAAGAANGVGTASSFRGPMDITISPVTGDLYIADQTNHLVRRITRNFTLSGAVAGHAGQHAIDLTVSDGNGRTGTQNFTLTVIDVAAPVITSPTSATFAENGQGTVYTAQATDLEALTYSLGANNDEAYFQIDQNNGALTFKNPPDFEDPVDTNNDNVYMVEVKASDGTFTSTQLVSITVTDVDDTAPVFTSATTASFVENSSGTVYTATATDINPITYSLGTSNDESFFDMNGNTGVVTFKASPDFETPADANADNAYVIEVKAHDGLNTASLMVTITVTNVDDTAPVFTSDLTSGFNENGTGPAYRAIATDVNPVTYSLGSTSEEAFFDISGSTGEVTFKVAPDFEVPLDNDANNGYVIEVVASDGINQASLIVTVSVIDANETPTFTTTEQITVNDNESYYYAVGTADIDGDAITLVGDPIPAWLTLSKNTLGKVSTLAGNGTTGFTNGDLSAATFNIPIGTAVDADGNIYVADFSNHAIRKITPAGQVSTLAGNGSHGAVNGTGTAASFTQPRGLAVDADGNVYVADFGNHLVRKITPAGEVTTLAGAGYAGYAEGTGTAAVFDGPIGVAVDTAGNVMVADLNNYRVRKISPAGVVTTLAGSGAVGADDGSAQTATFNAPRGITTDLLGNTYVVDHNNGLVRKISPLGYVSTLAGSGVPGSADGSGQAASFRLPSGIVADASGNLYVADSGNELIRKVTPEGVVTTIAGSGTTGFADGTGTAVQMSGPEGMSVDKAGNVYFADVSNARIRKMETGSYVLTGNAVGQGGTHTVSLEAQDASGAKATQGFDIVINDVTPLVLTSITTASFLENGTGTAYTVVATDTNPITYSLGSGNDEALFDISASTGAVTFKTVPDFEVPQDNDASNDYVIDVIADDGAFTVNQLVTISVTNENDNSPVFTGATTASVNDNATLKFLIPTSDGDGDVVTVTATSKPAWISLGALDVEVTTLAGATAGDAEGTGTAARFGNPYSVALDATGNLYIADQDNHKIRKVTPQGVMTTLAGSTMGDADGTGASAQFDRPGATAVDAAGNVYVADTYNHKIRKISPEGVVTTIAGSTQGFADGTGAAAQFNTPYGLDVDEQGNIFVGDLSNYRVRKISPEGVVTTLAGSTEGFADGAGTAAQFKSPAGVAVDAAGHVYVADVGNHKIRKISPAGEVSTLAGSVQGFQDGTGSNAQFHRPWGIAVDAQGNVFVADRSNHKVRKISPAGQVSTVAGSILGYQDGIPSVAQFQFLTGVAVDAVGTVYVADKTNHRIRQITPRMLRGEVTGQPAGSQQVILRADDGNGRTTTQSFTITVVDVTPPVFTSSTTASVVENTTTTVYTAAATDTHPVTYSLGSSHDEALFDVSGSTGAVTFKTAPDFETPQDSDRNNAYVIEVVADDGSEQTNHTVTISVTNVNDLPEFTSTPVTAVDDNATYDYPITTSDEDGDAVTVSAPALPGWLTFQAPHTVSTFVGTGSNFPVDGLGTEAALAAPGKITFDAQGNMYVSDLQHHIRKISPEGMVTTLAGSLIRGYAEGTGSAAAFNNPGGIAVDASGNVYVADRWNLRIRKISPEGVVSTLAGSGTSGFVNGTGTTASFRSLNGLTIDQQGNLYTFDSSNDAIRKISPTGEVTTAADLSGQQLTRLEDLVIDDAGTFYFPDLDQVKKLVPGQNPQTLASTPSGISAIALDKNGIVYAATFTDHSIYKIYPNEEVVKIAGTGNPAFGDGTGTQASFHFPEGLAIDARGDLFIGDSGNGRIRRLVTNPTVRGDATGQSGSHNVSIKADDGNGGQVSQDFTITVNDVTPPQFTSAETASFQENGTGTAYTAGASDTNPVTYSLGSSHDEALFDITAGVITFKVSPDFESPQDDNTDNNYVIEVKADDGVNTASQTVTISVTNQNESPVFMATPPTAVDDNATYHYPITTSDEDGDAITVIAHALPGWLTLQAPNTVSTFVGSGVTASVDGLGTAASFMALGNITFDAEGNMYVADYNQIRKITSGGEVTTLAGSLTSGFADGVGTNASFDQPTGIAVDASGNLFVADELNYRIRKITPEGVVSTLAGSGVSGFVDATGSSAVFGNLRGLDIDSSGNLYTVDIHNHAIRKISPEGVVTTVASSQADIVQGRDLVLDDAGTIYFTDFHGVKKLVPGEGIQLISALTDPQGIALDKSGNAYVSFPRDHLIYKVTLNGTASIIAGTGSQAFADGIGTNAAFSFPKGLAFDARGDLYVGDAANYRIRKVVVNPVLSGNATGQSGTHNVNLEATDAHGAEASQSFNITVNDVTLPLFTSAETASFQENGTGTAYTIEATDTNPVTYSLGSSHDEALFDLTAGVITFKTSPDFEAPADGNSDNVYVIEVKASDGANTASQNVTITVTNVDDTPPVFSSATAVSFAENRTGSAYTAVATDASLLTYSLGSSNDEALFNIASGVVTFKSAPDFETPADANADNAYVIEVIASDGVYTTSQAVTITVTNVDDTDPVFNSGITASFAENGTGTVYIAVATDANTLTYSLGSGHDEALFDIAGGTGIVTFNIAPDFEAPADADANNTYIVEVIASDGVNTVSLLVTITVTNVDDTAPVFTSGTTVSVEENSTGTVYTAIATDVNPITYSLGNGNDETLFNIAAGVVTFKSAPDFEAPADDNADNDYIIEVIANDGVNSTSQTVTITVTNVDEIAPVFTSATTASFAENSTATVYTAVATDVTPVTYSLGSSHDEALFNMTSGIVTFKSVPDFEHPADGNADNDYVIEVKAHDGINTASQTVTITVTNVDDTAPVFTSGTTASFEENGTGTVYTAAATDANVLTYGLGTGHDEALFDIAGGTGIATFKSAPDFENPADSDGNNTYIIEVKADDGVNSSTQLVTITVMDVDEIAPSVNITSAAGTTTNGAFDITITFSESVTGFEVSDLDLNNAIASNFAGSGAVYTATITPVTDGALTVEVAANVAADAVGNPNTAATQFGIAVDSSALTVSISSTSSIRVNGVFAVTITFSSAVADFIETDLSLANATAADFTGSGTSYTATITPLSDGVVNIDIEANVAKNAANTQNLAASQFSILNDATSPVFTSAATADFAENGTGTAYMAVATDANVVTYSLGNSNDEALFTMTSGVITFKSIPDFENPQDANGDNAYVIEVLADDGLNSTSQTVTITVTDIDDTAPVFTSLTTASFAENGTGAVYTAVATDANSLTYSLGIGHDEALFDIVGGTGVVTFKTTPDFENPTDSDGNNTYIIEVKASDDTNSASHTVTITVTDLDEIAPVFTSASATSFAENGTGTAYTALATDANALTYSLGTGNDEALFDIVSTTGLVTFKATPDFEAPVDGNSDNDYVIVVNANDGINSASQTVTITVTDVDDTSPVFTSSTTASFAENGTGTAYTAVATDANPVTYSLGNSHDEALFNITSGLVTFMAAPDFEAPTDDNGDNNYLIEVIANDGVNTASLLVTITVTNVDDTAPVFTSATATSFAENGTGTVYTTVATDANTVTYSLGTGNDEAFFNLEGTTGIVTFKSAPDFENPQDANGDNNYLIEIIASDGINAASQTVTITLTDIDEIAPVFTSAATASFAENGAGTVYTVMATDANPVTYSLGSSKDEALFNIAAGAITFKSVPDFEAPADGNGDNNYVIEVIASDGVNSTSQTVTITVTDVDDTAPVFTSAATASFAENGAGTVYTVMATDANPVTYSLGSGNDEALFNIIAGVVTFKSAPDFETPADSDGDNNYVIEVIASDGVNTASQVVTITVTNVDDTAPVFTSATMASFAENGTGTVYTAVATDANAVTYSLGTGNDEALFNIIAGVVTFKSAPDFEAPADGNADNNYVIEVIANDGVNTASQVVTITVTDVDDTAPVFTSATAASFAENGTGTAYTAMASDANSVTYGLGTGNDEALFNLEGATGIITFKTTPDFENPQDGNSDNGYILEIIASDGVNASTQVVTITVTNVEEAILRVTGEMAMPATALGSTSIADIIIHNDGDGELSVSNITYPEGFSGTTSGFVVAPFGSQLITVSFSPVEAKVYSGDIIIASNGGEYVLAVTGMGEVVTGIEDNRLKAEQIKVYPNPADHIMNIDLSELNASELDIAIVNLSGISFFNQKSFKDKVLKLNVSEYNSGIYIIQFSDGKSVVRKKVIIKH